MNVFSRFSQIESAMRRKQQRERERERKERRDKRRAEGRSKNLDITTHRCANQCSARLSTFLCQDRNVPKVLKKFSAFLATCKFITLFTTVRHLFDPEQHYSSPYIPFTFRKNKPINKWIKNTQD
jgi:hypothetical protein